MSPDPQVGDDVYYISMGSADGTYPSVPRAAKVTEITGPNQVSLFVMNPTGVFFPQGVTLGTGPGQWCWRSQVVYRNGQPAAWLEDNTGDTRL